MKGLLSRSLRSPSGLSSFAWGRFPKQQSTMFRLNVRRELSSSAAANEKFEVHDKFLRLKDGGNTHDFHWFWLYHNCSSWLHPTTKERIVDVPDIPLDVRPRKVDVHGGTVYIVWPAQRISEFSLEWLLKHSYAVNRSVVSPPASDVGLIELDFDKYKDNKKAYSLAVLDRIGTYGAVVVRNRGIDPEEVIRDFLPEGQDVWASHFGRIEDLRTDNTTNKNTDQLGYTNVGIAPHTDMPFMQNPPSMQLLLGLQAADRGGESYLVDARQAGYYLRSINPWAFDMLKTVNVKFHRKQKNFEAITHFPLIQTFGDHILQVRYSYFTLAPFNVPFEWMRLWYEAYNEFAKILQDEKFQFRFLLRKGDFVLYSNRTMVHAREAFSGPRWVKGLYFDQDKVMSHLQSVASVSQK